MPCPEWQLNWSIFIVLHLWALAAAAHFFNGVPVGVCVVVVVAVATPVYEKQAKQTRFPHRIPSTNASTIIIAYVPIDLPFLAAGFFSSSPAHSSRPLCLFSFVSYWRAIFFCLRYWTVIFPTIHDYRYDRHCHWSQVNCPKKDSIDSMAGHCENQECNCRRISLVICSWSIINLLLSRCG